MGPRWEEGTRESAPGAAKKKVDWEREPKDLASIPGGESSGFDEGFVALLLLAPGNGFWVVSAYATCACATRLLSQGAGSVC